MRLTASDIVRAIAKLPRNRAYNYVSSKNAGKIIIDDIVEPEGPIYIKRYNPNKGKGRSAAKRDPMSSQMLWRVANAINPGMPVNIDRILGASYNTRSALEALLAHTPEFYYCYPGRIESISSSSKVKKGHKHLLWNPDEPHEAGVLTQAESEIVISEIPTTEAVYEALVFPEVVAGEPDWTMNIDVARRHAQIQIALVEIGRYLGYRTWVANNDKSIEYKGKKLGEMDGVIVSLKDMKMIAAFEDAARAALLIDCIWFRNSKFMPAVIEIEQTTGVVRGLARMKKLKDAAPSIRTRFVIAAPDEDRDKVMRESNEIQFRDLNTHFFPYSAIEELYSLCQRRKIKGISDEFLACFMEPCLPALN